MQEHDEDLIQEEREERYNRALQRRLATCGDRDYPAADARQDIIEAEQERLRLMGIVDISEGEE
jgi:hypothetical protein